MRILGLTGSIGMGKSTAAAMFRRDGIAVHDADAVVHDLMRRGGAAVPAVAKAFPEAVRDGAVDRRALGALVFGRPEALRRLEAILHPLVRRRMRRFLQQAGRRGDDLVVLDIPLLFETGGERFCDAVAVVSAPRLIQRQRVLARPGMTKEKFAAILAAQMPDREKRRRADWVVPTGLGRRPTRLALRALRRQALARPGRRWRPSLKVA
ncbi:dephospho-CoA kinase [Inquilinus limosus]|uniref:Dephospho-CoA kinase n=1 Tax=Inquilinus limosus TaxID=171674 RepID=A0A211ZLX3_9PROT|nr:dephospho-CoA kinase [Inquilinus limosus]OWJ66272.1 dephospho-CoA kinase [Inquilinus limosus]